MKVSSCEKKRVGKNMCESLGSSGSGLMSTMVCERGVMEGSRSLYIFDEAAMTQVGAKGSGKNAHSYIWAKWSFIHISELTEEFIT